MASESTSAAANGSGAQHIDVDDIEQSTQTGGTVEVVDEEMGGDAEPTAEGTQTPQSVNADEPQDGSILAPSFYQNNSTKKRQTGSRVAETNAAAADDDEDMLDPELPGREERVGTLICEAGQALVLLAQAWFLMAAKATLSCQQYLADFAHTIHPKHYMTLGFLSTFSTDLSAIRREDPRSLHSR